MILPIVIYGSSLLREHSLEITKDDSPEIIVNNLFEILIISTYGYSSAIENSVLMFKNHALS